MEMTIKQLANELKVGKTTINRVIAQLDLQDKLHKIGNRYVLTESQIEQIKLTISHQSNHETEPIKQKSNQTNYETEPTTPKTNQSNHENELTEPKPHQSNQMHQSNQDLQLSILDRQLETKDIFRFKCYKNNSKQKTIRSPKKTDKSDYCRNKSASSLLLWKI